LRKKNSLLSLLTNALCRCRCRPRLCACTRGREIRRWVSLLLSFVFCPFFGVWVYFPGSDGRGRSGEAPHGWALGPRRWSLGLACSAAPFRWGSALSFFLSFFLSSPFVSFRFRSQSNSLILQPRPPPLPLSRHPKVRWASFSYAPFLV
jgi:hypothetical protein